MSVFWKLLFLIGLMLFSYNATVLKIEYVFEHFAFSAYSFIVVFFLRKEKFLRFS